MIGLGNGYRRCYAGALNSTSLQRREVRKEIHSHIKVRRNRRVGNCAHRVAAKHPDNIIAMSRVGMNAHPARGDLCNDWVNSSFSLRERVLIEVFLTVFVDK